MGADVIPFGRKPKEGEPETEQHLRGKAKCLACGHLWEAVTPVGSRVHYDKNGPESICLECPECHCPKGVYEQFVNYTDCLSWHCFYCNNFLFSVILAKGDVPTLACASCGALTNSLDIFNGRES